MVFGQGIADDIIIKLVPLARYGMLAEGHIMTASR